MKTFNLLLTYFLTQLYPVAPSEEGNSWNYATATTKFNGKVLLLAFVTQVKGMTKEEIVKALVEQVMAMGFKIRLITLDAGFWGYQL